MRLKDILLTLFIIVLLSSLFVHNMFKVQYNHIKQNWPKYRCNPTVMPFASHFGHDAAENFSYCIQNMQTSYMGTLLQPTHYANSVLSGTLGGIVKDVNSVREKISSFLGNIAKIVGSIFGVFMNLIIEFQRIFNKIKDIMGKIIGVMVTLVYLLVTGVETGGSIMAGPIGETLRFVCFHPDTPITLEDGSKVNIKNVSLGDVIHNGSKVIGTMKLRGNSNEDMKHNTFYKIRSEELDCDLYVTGSHLIRNETTQQYVAMKEHPETEECPDMKTEDLICLITDDHLIRIGEHTFWDWDD